MTRRLASDEGIHSFAQGGGHIDESRDESIVVDRSVEGAVGRSVEGAVGRRRPSDLDAECRHVDGWWASRRRVR